jgi:hypothetical protein
VATQERGKQSELELELDRIAWNLPSPPPEEVRLPPAANWPIASPAVTKERTEAPAEG